MKASKSRCLAKAVTFRIVASLSTVIIVFVFTGRMEAAIGIGLADTVVKLAVYYFHERAWNRIDYGRLPIVLDNNTASE